jgi:hypothetical protein
MRLLFEDKLINLIETFVRTSVYKKVELSTFLLILKIVSDKSRLPGGLCDYSSACVQSNGVYIKLYIKIYTVEKKMRSIEI